MGRRYHDRENPVLGQQQLQFGDEFVDNVVEQIAHFLSLRGFFADAPGEHRDLRGVRLNLVELCQDDFLDENALRRLAAGFETQVDAGNFPCDLPLQLFY